MKQLIPDNPPQALPLPGGALLDFSRPRVMAIVNCTPDSFYVPHRTPDPEDALRRALEAEAGGADIVDFGAEASGPGSVYVGEEEELRRLMPALRLFRRHSSLPVSIDTRKASVARAALDEGADIINDISALQDPGMIPLCAGRGAAVVVMHGEGLGFGARGGAGDLVGELRNFLLAAVRRAEAGGIPGEKIIIDPGFGFGKSTEENLLLLARLAEIRFGDYPLLVGLSRKRFIGTLTRRDAEDRLPGTLAANAAALMKGADIIRVHDAAPAADLAAVAGALRYFEGDPGSRE
ncbi:MAG: dihydropteroate synthase [Treponema sp.]|nr:dihydropteroate synthase [Treponema sp.]